MQKTPYLKANAGAYVGYSVVERSLLSFGVEDILDSGGIVYAHALAPYREGVDRLGGATE